MSVELTTKLRRHTVPNAPICLFTSNNSIAKLGKPVCLLAELRQKHLHEM